jgi:hypothetical protein
MNIGSIFTSFRGLTTFLALLPQKVSPSKEDFGAFHPFHVSYLGSISSFSALIPSK